jgi:hypothetical protein
MTDALIYCDMTTTPDGELATVEARAAEIRKRYGGIGPVGEFVAAAAPLLLLATDRMNAVSFDLRGQGSQPG